MLWQHLPQMIGTLPGITRAGSMGIISALSAPQKVIANIRYFV